MNQFRRVTRTLWLFLHLPLALGASMVSVEALAEVRVCLPERRVRETAEILQDLTTVPLEYAVLDHECHKYSGAHLSARADCEEASWTMLKTLDCRGIQDSICFTDDLDQMLHSGEVARYLVALRESLVQAVNRQETFRLWDWTLAYVKGDRSKALHWLGVLFQDRDALRTLQYLRKQTFEGHLPYSQAYANAVVAVTDAASRPGISQYVQLYPDGVDSNEPDLYHFYTTAYLADRIHSENPGLGNVAHYLPTLFNSVYEFRYLQPSKPGAGFLGMGKFRGFLGSKPKSISQAPAAFFGNSYLGYAGAEWGAQASKPVLSSERFKSEYASDPSAFLGDLLNE